MSRLAKLGLALPLLVVSCRPPAPSKAAAPSVIQACSYRLRLASSGLVSVDANCRASGAVSFSAADPGLARHLQGKAPDRGGRFAAEAGHFSNSVSVAELAGASADAD